MGRAVPPSKPLALLLLLAATALPGAPACDRGDAAGDGAAIEVRVETIAVDERSQSPVVILEERQGSRRLPIWIGFPEANSIASELRAVESARPNTHDLAKRLIDGLEGSVERVVVTDLSAGIYYARIFVARAGSMLEIDARPSDAIAIALRYGAPVFVNELLFEKALQASAGEDGHRI